jgi:fibronectin type 3 domain-containing protein
LSWTAPANDGGGNITGYRVTPYIGGNAQTPILTGSQATTYTVSGLDNGTAYTFTVAAINKAGTGHDSSASASVTPVQATVPGAPSSVQGIARDGAVAVGWSAPSSDGGSSITGYRVTPYLGGAAQTPVTFNSADTDETVTGLTNGLSYTFTVATRSEPGPNRPHRPR